MSATSINDIITQKKTGLTRLKTRRRLWLDVHLWLGLGFGFFLAVIGLTGSVLVFWHEIDAAINTDLYEASSGQDLTPKPIDEIIAVAKQSAPNGWDSVWLDAPLENGNYVFGFYYPQASPKPEEAESLNIAVNPYTAEVTGR